jgi:hypothetical protein
MVPMSSFPGAEYALWPSRVVDAARPKKSPLVRTGLKFPGAWLDREFLCGRDYLQDKRRGVWREQIRSAKRERRQSPFPPLTPVSCSRTPRLVPTGSC